MATKVCVYQCKRCGHEWASKLDRPHICPKCKTPYWDTPRLRPTTPIRYSYKCLRCGHQWASRLDHPRICPKCKAVYWDTAPKQPHTPQTNKDKAHYSFNPMVKVIQQLQEE